VALAKQQMPKKRKSKDAKHFVLCRPGTKKRKNEIQRREKRKYVEMPGTSDCVDQAGGGRFA